MALFVWVYSISLIILFNATHIIGLPFSGFGIKKPEPAERNSYGLIIN